MLQHTGLESCFLELELTEDLLLEDSDSRIRVLHQLNEIGVGLAIDDFGTGYSSLSYLQRFPISALKIDQCFVRNLNIVKDDASIVSAIIALGHSLSLKVVAEGVEGPEQLDFLRSNSCDEVQGFYFSPALPSLDFANWVNAQCPEGSRGSDVEAATAPPSRHWNCGKARH
jgi:EAL domain-containing protein (putative c-di-GMP-specific phosphodiesterase class I)